MSICRPVGPIKPTPVVMPPLVLSRAPQVPSRFHTHSKQIFPCRWAVQISKTT